MTQPRHLHRPSDFREAISFSGRTRTLAGRRMGLSVPFWMRPRNSVSYALYHMSRSLGSLMLAMSL